MADDNDGPKTFIPPKNKSQGNIPDVLEGKIRLGEIECKGKLQVPKKKLTAGDQTFDIEAYDVVSDYEYDVKLNSNVIRLVLLERNEQVSTVFKQALGKMNLPPIQFKAYSKTATYPSFVNKTYTTWTSAEVKEWLGCIQFPQQVESAGKFIHEYYDDNGYIHAKFSKIDGSKLDKFDTLVQINKGAAQDTILVALKRLKENNSKFSIAEYDKYKAYKKFVDGILSKKDKSEKHREWFDSGYSIIMQNLDELINPTKIKQTIVQTIFKEDSLNVESSYDIGAKLVIVALAELSSTDSVKNAASNFKTSFLAYIKGLFNSVSQNEHFGIFHSGVSIQGCLIDWNESAFVHIGDVSSKKAVLAADCKFKGNDKLNIVGRDFDILLDKIAQLISYWNINVVYTKTPEISLSSVPQGSCQTFTLELLNILEIGKFTQHINNYLAGIKWSVTNDKLLRFSDEFKATFKLANQQIIFTSHAELDDFANKCMSQDANFAKNWQAEYDLMKAFDRAYWLQYKSNAQNVASCHPSKNGCAFVEKKQSAVNTQVQQEYQADEAYVIDDF